GGQPGPALCPYTTLFRSKVKVRGKGPAPSTPGGRPAGRVASSRYRYRGPPALGPVPDRPSPPKGCTPTTAPTMLRLTYMLPAWTDRKSTRLNSSHVKISY